MKTSTYLRNFGLTLLGIMLFWSVQAQRHVGYKTHGFTNITQAHAIIPSNTYPMAFGFSTSNGILANPYFYGGLNLGLDVYGTDAFAVGMADLRFYFLDDTFSPSFIGQGGYAYGIGDRKGGPVVNFGVGLRYYLSHSVAFQPSLTYRMMYLPAQNDDKVIANKTLISGPSINIGLSF